MSAIENHGDAELEMKEVAAGTEQIYNPRGCGYEHDMS
jgi:hypothetical protein